MNTHNISFCGEIRKYLSSYPFYKYSFKDEKDIYIYIYIFIYIGINMKYHWTE